MITANDYERTYVCVKNSLNATRQLDRVVEFLQSIPRPVTCREIGLFVWGDAYRDIRTMNSYSAQLGQMLRHLRQGGFIKIGEIDGAPVEVSSWEWVDAPDAPPSKIKVHDDEGNEYWIANPKYDYRRHGGSYKEVKKTIIPKIKTYLWVGE